MSRSFTMFADVGREVEPPAEGILTRTLFQDDRIKVVAFGFAPGETLSEHTATMPAIVHVLQGRARLTLGDEPVEAGPGTWIHMPAHLPHSVAAQTSVVMLLLLIKPQP